MNDAIKAANMVMLKGIDPRKHLDGQINLDSEFAKELGFTSDKFDDVSWLWKINDSIYVSFIISKHEGKGNVRKLLNKILVKGYNVKIPSPFARMAKIAFKMGFVETIEHDKQQGPCTVLYKPTGKATSK